MSSGQHDLFCMTSKRLCGALIKVSISSDLQRSSVEEFKIERVYFRSLIWIPLAGSKEKRN